jgi:hypothetical protein
MTKRRRIVIAAIACGLIASAIVATQMGFGASSGPGGATGAGPSGTARSARAAEGAQRAGRHRGHGGNHPHNPGGPWPGIEGGELISGGVFAPSTVLWPDNNLWKVQSHTQTTDVEAGGDATQKSNGLFFIIRSYALRSRPPQTTDIVSVAGSGPVTITKAPLGRKVVVWAQKRGNLEFTSTSGITGTLHLKDDTVTLNP